MARGMIGAATLSGVGQGLTNVSNALGQAAQFYGASMLQRDRQEFETNRMKILEEYAAAREGRQMGHAERLQAQNQDFQRGLAQENRGADIVLRGQEREAARQEKAADREFTSTENARNRESTAELHDQSNETTRRGQDITKEHGDKQLDMQGKHYAAIEAHQKALEGLYRAHYANDRDKVKQFITDEKGGFFAITESGATKPVLNPLTGEPIVGTKQLTDSAKELAKLHTSRGETYLKLANDALASPEEKSKNQQLASEAFAQAATYLSEKPKPAGGGIQIKDRFAGSVPNSSAGSPSPQPEPPAPKPRPDKVVPATTEPVSPVTAGPTDALSFGVDKFKEGAGMLADKAKSALLPSAIASGVTLESKGQALAATSRSNADTLVNAKQQEVSQREAAVLPPKPTGMVGASMFSQPKPAATITPPQLKAEARTGEDVLSQWTPEQQDRARQLMAQVKSGKIERDDFIAGIIALSESGTKGLALAEGMLRNMGLQ